MSLRKLMNKCVLSLVALAAMTGLLTSATGCEESSTAYYAGSGLSYDIYGNPVIVDYYWVD